MTGGVWGSPSSSPSHDRCDLEGGLNRAQHAASDTAERHRQFETLDSSGFFYLWRVNVRRGWRSWPYNGSFRRAGLDLVGLAMTTNGQAANLIPYPLLPSTA
jgi:hypothetical protein